MAGFFSALLGAPSAHAQADYPDLQGTAERPGHNTNPMGVNSGPTVPQWFTPYGTFYTTNSVLDNADTTATTAGVVTFTSGAWNSSAGATSEAYPVFYTGTTAPDYYYTGCVNAGSTTNPTVGATASFNWTFNAQTTAPIEYALYVWLPTGPTGTATGYDYPLRYYTYLITYGTGQQYIDVVDTYSAGVGWVRLGNGGFPTNQAFVMAPIAGATTPTITVQLLNTIASGSPTVPNPVVYASAAMAVPVVGSIAASPTSAYLRDSSGNPIQDPMGDPDAGGGTAYFTRILEAINLLVPGYTTGNTLTTSTQGQVVAYQMNASRWPGSPPPNAVPQILWSYSPSASNPNDDYYITQGVATSGFVTDTTNPHYQGTSYYSDTIVAATTSAMTGALQGTDTVSYTESTLPTGSYSIYVYVPGNGGGETYGQAVIYNIYEGTNTTPIYSGTLNETSAGGWVQVGSSFPEVYTAGGSNNQSLSIQITNASQNPADVGLTAYANAVEFVGTANYSINSTPIVAQVPIVPSGGGTAVMTQVAIVADETGKIHCLDYTGNTDGTTTEYWSYPSTATPNNPYWTAPNDPNLQGIDGPVGSTVPTAQMPTQFNLSTACVRYLGASAAYPYRLYIASTNGRIYCLDMGGRGDWAAATGTIGTTQRLWSYPDDYPAPIAKPSNLGLFRGSLAYGDTSDGLAAPTVFAAAPQGRVFALDGAGTVTTTTIGTRTTTVDWQYPAQTAVALAPIAMTPSLAFGNLYFGTLQNPTTGGPGVFYALNASTGNPVWTFNGSTDTYPNAPSVLDFVAEPVTAPAAMLTEASEPAAPTDMVYVLNQNTYVYGLNAETGAIAAYTAGGTTVFYRTNELGITSSSGLGFQWKTVYDPPGDPEGTNPAQYPVIEVPTSEGHIYSLFANVWDYNLFTDVQDGGTVPADLLAWGYGLEGNQISAPAFSNDRFIVDSDLGFQYVFTPNAAGTGLEVAGNFPGTQVIPPNQPGPPDAFRYLKVRFVTAAGYQALRAGTLKFSDISENAAYSYPAGNGSTYAFEWGDTAYMVVYGLPYETLDTGANTISPPMINIRISVGGQVVRQLQVDSSQFSSPTLADALYNPNNVTWPTNWSSTLQDGYGALAFTFQGGGANALPPGKATVTADVTTASLGNHGAAQEIASDPNDYPSASANGTTSGVPFDHRQVSFSMNNPIGVEVYDANGTPTSIAVSNYAYDLGAQANGSPLLPSYTNTDPTNGNTISTAYTNQLMQSLGLLTDGSSGTATFNLYDRSDMALIRPPGQGMFQNVRFARSGLAWEGGASTIINALDQTLYPGFEDQPVNSPNNSLDYPDITPDSLGFTVTATAAAGGAGNPLLTGVSLTPPKSSTTGTYMTAGESSPSTRILQPTPVSVSVNVPQYQPGNNAGILPQSAVNTGNLFSTLQADGQGHSDTGHEPQGYFGNLSIFVDSSNSNSLTSQDSFRAMNLAVGVMPSYRIHVDTPSVDLGSLTAGTGYGPGTTTGSIPWSPGYQNSFNGAFSPWNNPTGSWSGAYKPFTIRSDSNVNVLPLRMAKAEDTGTGTPPLLPWGLYASGNDIQAWLDGSLNLWSNLDSHFALQDTNGAGTNQVILPKPRVSDRVPTTLDPNPHPRANPNLGVGTGAPDLNAGYDGAGPNPHSPAISMSIPLGFPVGTYATNALNQIRFIDDLGALPEIWDNYGSGVEPFSDPGLSLSFTVRETRLTTTNDTFASPMADSIGAGTNPAASYRNVNPAAMRDGFGNLIAAWASDRPTQAPATQPSTEAPNDATRIYVASVANSSSPSASASAATPFLGIGNDPITGAAPTSPLRDLNFFTPASGTAWFAGQTPSGYPSGSLFTSLPTGYSAITGTEKYGLPAFPVTGEKDPLWSVDGNLTNLFETKSYMGFVGSVQVSTGSGRLQESKVYATTVATSSGSNTVNLGTAYSTSDTPVNPGYVPASLQNRGDDPLTIKGKPSVVLVHQTPADEAFVFYPVTAANQTGIHMARFVNNGFTPYVDLDFGTGFDSVDAPSATLRPYQGTNSALPGQLIDLTFSGKLRGRSSPEIYLGRLLVAKPSDDSGAYHLVDSNLTDAEVPGSGSPFAFMSLQTNERLLSEGHGIYRARGVEWNRSYTESVAQYSSTGIYSSVLVPGTRSVDRETGLISWTSTLGGKVFVDPELGTVRFTSGLPGQNSEIRLTYQPAFIRVTNGSGAAYSDPAGIYDDHYLSDTTMWFNKSGTSVADSDHVESGRTMVLFDRSASAGQTAQPYFTTMRFGVRLPTPVYASAGGAVTVVVTNNIGPYEVDPAAGRIYFTALDEDNPAVSVTYTGVDIGTGNSLPSATIGPVTVSYVLEKDETPVMIDQAVNEGSLSAFLDPFSYQSSGTASNDRPPLVWMFYSSTRNGYPDVYFQTIAPRLSPLLAPPTSP